eukprot:gene7532-7448_t
MFPFTKHFGLYTETPEKTVRVPLVTGGGRSGTHSVSYYLESIGVPSRHEVVSTDGVVVSWWHAPNDAAGLPGKHIGHIDGPRKLQVQRYGAMFDPVIHVVRDPLDHITSLSNCLCGRGNITAKGPRLWDRKSYSYASKYIPLHSKQHGTRLARAAVYWLHWNQLAAEHKGVRTKLEDLKSKASAVEEMLKALRLHELPALAAKGYTSTADFIAKNSPLPPFTKLGGVSEVHPDRLTWAALSNAVGREMAELIRKQAVEYGYAEHDTEQARTDASSGPSKGWEELRVGDLPAFKKSSSKWSEVSMLSAADRKGAEGVDGTTSEFKKEGVVQRDRGVLTAVDEQSHILKWLNIEKIIPS